MCRRCGTAAAAAPPGHADMVGRSIRPRVPGPQHHRQRFAGPPGTVAGERPERMMAVSALERRPGQLLVRMGGDQGRADIDDQRRCGRDPASGACCPASPQARSRAAARAAWIAFSAAGASAARASIVRDTVGSEATSPNTPGSARSNAISARQSPPSPSATARSSSTFAGSCTAVGRRQRASPADSAQSRPDARIVAVSSAPPACETTPRPAPLTRMGGNTR